MPSPKSKRTWCAMHFEPGGEDAVPAVLRITQVFPADAAARRTEVDPPAR